MSDNFTACLAFTLKAEGGFVDDPYDPGGATNKGITLATFQAFTGNPDATPTDLKLIEDTTVSDIYQSGYWAPARAAELPPGVDLMTFDMAVNSGAREAILLLQRAAKVHQDGIIGPITLAAVQAVDPLALVLSLGSAQYWFYRGLPTWQHFGRGWASRVKAREDAATTLAKGS